MEKRYGSPKRQDGLYNVGRNKYDLFYGYGEDEQGGWNYYQRLTHCPTWEEVKTALIDCINEHTKKKILTGFEWQGESVWLSDENQRDFMMMEKLTDENYPLEVKINEDAEGNPKYYTFVSAEEFTVFSTQASQHVIDTLRAGWTEKDSLDKSTYGF